MLGAPKENPAIAGLLFGGFGRRSEFHEYEKNSLWHKFVTPLTVAH